MLIIQTPDLDSFATTFTFSICNVADTSREASKTFCVCVRVCVGRGAGGGAIRKEKNDQILSILDLFLVTIIYFVLKE